MPKLFFFLLSFTIISNVFAQDRQIVDPKLSPFQKTEIKIGIVEVALEYSRPSRRGRAIFGALVPYDQVWRTGANVNTKITFDEQVIVSGVEIPAGTYTLFSKPNIQQWEIYFHTELNTYGLPDSIEEKNIIAKVFAPAKKSHHTVETFSISFDHLTTNSAILTIAWEQTYVQLPIRIPTSKILEERLQRERNTLIEDYRAAANIHYEIEKDYDKALQAINYAIALLEDGYSFEEWVAKADLSDRHLPNKYRLKSEILAGLGQKEEAIKFAKRSLYIANLVDDEYYRKRNAENIEKWSH